MKKYRIVPDRYSGFEVQYKWLCFWKQVPFPLFDVGTLYGFLFSANTFRNELDAKNYILMLKEYEEKLI